MIICICHRVSDRDIACAVRQGCLSFEEVQDELRVATACRACRDCARDAFQKHAQVVTPAGFVREATAPHHTAHIAVVLHREAAPTTSA